MQTDKLTDKWWDKLSPWLFIDGRVCSTQLMFNNSPVALGSEDLDRGVAVDLSAVKETSCCWEQRDLFSHSVL